MSGNRAYCFWQTEVSPHLLGLLEALAQHGSHVTLIASQLVSKERAELGWTEPQAVSANIRLLVRQEQIEKYVKSIPRSVVHVCQGIRSNGIVGYAQRELDRRRIPYWVMMESVNDSGLMGAVRRLVYRRLFVTNQSKICGVLAIGALTANWVAERGFPASRIFPFAYFFDTKVDCPVSKKSDARSFRFIFVGRFDKGKNLPLLLSAFSKLGAERIELIVLGGNKDLAERVCREPHTQLNEKICWLGTVSKEKVAGHLASADCLVLPSLFDGWGAVAAEALQVGTPVICSDRCGVSNIVRASGHGLIFKSGSLVDLMRCLSRMLDAGPPSVEERIALSDWAACLNSAAGATYLSDILNSVSTMGAHPLAPWISSKSRQHARLSDDFL